MKFNWLKKTALVLGAVGAINWGLVGLLNANLVTVLLGNYPMVVKGLYVLIGASGIYALVRAFKKR